MEWLLPPADLSLPPDAVHVWCVALDLAPGAAGQLEDALSTDERQRAAGFRFEHDRQRYIIGRARLRAILARYVGGDPSQLVFQYSAGGKPALAADHAQIAVGDALTFNLTHSRGLALYAVARGRAIGVDIEYMRPLPDAGQIAERFFAPGERARLRMLPPDQQVEGFFACWTRKEAYVKATGEGLFHGLDQFEVSLAPGEPAALLSIAGEPEGAARWSLTSLTPATGYMAALAVEGQSWRLACWRWPD